MRLRAAFALLAATTVTVAGWWMLSNEALTVTYTRFPALVTGAALTLIVPGIVGMWRRPNDPQPTRSAVSGIVFALAYFRAFSPPWASTLGAFAWYASPLALAWLLLGWQRPTRDWRTAGVCWMPLTAAAVGLVLVSGARHISSVLGVSALRSASWVHHDYFTDTYVRQANPLALLPSATAVRVLWALWIAWVVVVSGFAAGRLIRRSARRGAGAEHQLGRLVATAAVMNLVAASALGLLSWPERVIARSPAGSIVIGRWYSDLLVAIPTIAAAVSGAAMVWDELVRPRLAHSASGAIQLSAASSPETVRLDLMRVLGDPTVQLVFPRAGAGWMDGRGQACRLAAETHRAAMILTAGGEPMAAIEFDASLLQQADLLEVAATSAALSLDGQRLAAVAFAAAEDARSSAARLLEAADDARRTVEARIADGPDRILAGVALMLDERPVPLGAVHDGLREAVADLRRVARGLAPIALSDGGLAVALDDLATAAPLPVDLWIDTNLRLPTAIEVTIYLVASDALQGTRTPSVIIVSTTADAASVRIQGWWGPLETVATDRVAALGGAIDVDATGITVSIPFDRS